MHVHKDFIGPIVVADALEKGLQLHVALGIKRAEVHKVQDSVEIRLFIVGIARFGAIIAFRLIDAKAVVNKVS